MAAEIEVQTHAAQPSPQPQHRGPYLGQFPIEEPNKLPPGSPMRNLYAAWQAAGEAVKAFGVGARKIETDESLSPFDKMAAKLNLASELRKGISAHDELLSVAEARANEAREKALHGVVAKGAPDQHRATEITNWFRDKVPADDRLSVLSQLIGDNDIEGLASIVGAPGALELLTDALRQCATDGLLSIVAPDAMKEIDLIDSVLGAIKFAREAAQRWIADGTGRSETDDHILR